MSASQYFISLHDAALDLADRLPLGEDFATMVHVTDVLRPAIEADAHDANPFTAPPPSIILQVRTALSKAERRSAGLNTVGMLLDRLSILAMKHWALTHRLDAPEKAAELRATQIQELADALSEAQPGSSSVNNKMTTHKVKAEAASFPEAYYGLFTTNLLLWESQEVLYNKDLTVLSGDELRAYVAFFSEGNLIRNAYIQLCDQLWWSLIKSAER